VKYYLILLLAFSQYFAFSQKNKFSFPKISEKGKSLNDFVPSKWKIIDSAFFDLNNVKQRDYVFVIESSDSAKISDSCVNNTPFYPKMLLIILQQSDGSFKLSTVATKFFGDDYCNWGVHGQDAYENIFKRGNTLGINFSTGGSLMTVLYYYFKFGNGDWYLVGAKREIYMVGKAYEGMDVEDINLLTGERKNYDTSDFKKGKKIIKKSIVEHKSRIKLKDFEGDSDVPFSSEN
jgi:hypothetical protein